MFTIKLYRDGNFRQRILEAESFTIIRQDSGIAEITLHRPVGPNGEFCDVRYDITGDNMLDAPGPERFERAIIENAAGKTTEIIGFAPRLDSQSPQSRLAA